MSFRTRIKDPRTILLTGSLSLVLALLSPWLLPWTLLGPDLADGVMGFLVGVAIPTLPFGIYLQRRSGKADTSCA